MKLPRGQLAGEIPRKRKDDLPPGFSEIARNCRFLSGSLESWNDLLNAGALSKGAVVASIFPLDVKASFGGPFWLHWRTAEIVNGQPTFDVMRGAIVGDDTERFYYTGAAEPRVSNRELATSETEPPAKDDPTGYPYRWYKWGVPAPDAAPELEVTTVEQDSDEIEVTNAGAEDGTLFWANEIGTLTSLSVAELPALAAFEGTRYFSFGSAAVSEIRHVAIDLASNGIVAGSSLSLTWQQAKGPNESTAALGFRFYNGGIEIGTGLFSTEIAPAGLDYTWNERMYGVTVPAGATSLEVVMKATKVGAGDTDAYIDDIMLNITLPGFSSDGSTLAPWTVVRRDGNSGVIIDAGIGWPAPSIRFNSRRESVPAIYRNINLRAAQRIDIEFEYERQGISDTDFRVVIGASPTGSGKSFTFFTDGIHASDETSWTGGFGPRAENLSNDPYVGNGRFRASFSMLKSETGPYVTTINVVEMPSETEIYSGSYNVDALGDFIGFKIQHGGSIPGLGYLDNINIALQRVTIEGDPNIGTAYVVVFKNGFGERSAPSDPSDTILKDQDDSVLVTTTTTAPAGYDIQTKEIYRFAGNPAVLLFVAEIPLAQAEYLDAKRDDELGGVLETDENWLPPPTLGHHPVSAPNGISGILEKNRWIPSPINRPHAFLQNVSLAFDYPAVVQGIIDNDFIVATQANPYIVTGTDPAQMTSSKLEKPQGCVSAASAVVMEYLGFVYASMDGLTRVNRNMVEVITLPVISEREWRLLNPVSMIGCTHDGKYFGFYDATGIGGEAAGFIFDPRPGGNGWTRLDFSATACSYNPFDDKLHLVIAGVRYVWDGDAAKRPSLYRSKEHVLPRYMSPSCFQVKANDYSDLTFRLYYDGVLFYTTTVTGVQERVLPAGRCRRIQYEIEGVFDVTEEPQIAERMEELE